MTIEKAWTVLVLLEAQPDLRLYQYRHAHTGALLYAMFPHGQADDMAEAPMVREPVLLYERGTWTAAGARWRAAHRRPLEAAC